MIPSASLLYHSFIAHSHDIHLLFNNTSQSETIFQTQKDVPMPITRGAHNPNNKDNNAIQKKQMLQQLNVIFRIKKK